MPVALDPSLKDLAKTLFFQGLPPKLIASQTGVSPFTLKNWIARESWGKTKTKAVEVLESVAQPSLAVQVANDMNARSKAAQEGLAEVLTGQIEVLKNDPARSVGQLRNTPQGQGRAAVAKTIAETAAKVFGWDAQQSRAIVNVNILNQVSDSTLEV